MSHLNELKEAARERVAHLLPRSIFHEFEDLNRRLLIAVTLLQRGERGLAYQLFETIATHGPQENENRHFAYVRSLVEMAELDAENGRYAEAEIRMAEGLAQFPETMGYMMSRIHLKVYLAYYKFRLNKREEAYRKLKELIEQETDRFRMMDPEEGRNLVGPGLCYAIHQLSLFYGEEGKWIEAVETFRQIREYASQLNHDGWEEAEELVEEERWQEAFTRMTESTNYEAA